MADAQIGGNNGLPASSLGTGAGNRTNLNGADVSAQSGLDMDNADTITALKNRLIAIDSGFYTTINLLAMTHNDMVYAIRVNDFASTIKQ